MIRWLTNRTRAVAPDDFGAVCPGCRRYDWPETPVVPIRCRSGVHRTKRCESCDHLEVRFDCESHG